MGPGWTALCAAVVLPLAGLASDAVGQGWVVAQVRRTDASLAVAILPQGRSDGVSGHVLVFPRSYGELGQRGMHFLVDFEFDCASGRYGVGERRVADAEGQPVRAATDAEISRYGMSASLVRPIHANFCDRRSEPLSYWADMDATSERVISAGAGWQVP